MDFEKTSSKFVSTTLSGGFGLHDIPTKFQSCSDLLGRAPTMNTLGYSGKQWRQRCDFKTYALMAWLYQPMDDGDYKDLFVLKLT